MSYDVRWKIPFVAINGDKYRVEILEDDWGPEVTTLIGADSPFETDENTSDDIFAPVRTQSGALRIADNGYDADGNEFDYQDIMPTDTFDRQVRLWQEGNGDAEDILRWIGYIKPDTLTSRMYEEVSIREFRLICPLGCMSDMELSFTNNRTNIGTLRTIGQILHQALSLVNVDWANVYQQRSVTHSEDRAAVVSLMNFLSDDIKPSHSEMSDNDFPDNFTATWTDKSTSWGQVVENICKFFGWTLYSRGIDLYITAHDAVSYCYVLDFDDLLDDRGYLVPDSEMDTTIYTDSLQYASTNHTQSRMLGKREIIVRSAVNNGEYALDVDFESLSMEYLKDYCGNPILLHVTQQSVTPEYSIYYVLKKLTGSDNPKEQWIGNYQVYENRVIQSGQTGPEFIICRYENFNGSDFVTKTELSLRAGICHYTGGQSGALICFLKTLHDVIIPEGAAICIDASASLNYNGQKYNDPQPTLEGRTVKCALQVGNQYWNGIQFTTEFSTFTLRLNKDGKLTYPKNEYNSTSMAISGVLFDEYAHTRGYCIYTENAVSYPLIGRMKLMIYANPGQPIQEDLNCVLNSLTVSVYNKDNRYNPENASSHEFKQTASTRFREDLTVNLQMASGVHNIFGTGQLYDMNSRNGILLGTIPYHNGGDMQPEQNLLQRLVRQYSSTTNKQIIEVMDNMTAERPNSIFRPNEYANEKYRLQSCSHKWRDGSMKLTLIEDK